MITSLSFPSILRTIPDPFTRTRQLGVKTVCLHETALMSIYTSNEANFAALWLITARTCSLRISTQTVRKGVPLLSYISLFSLKTTCDVDFILKFV